MSLGYVQSRATNAGASNSSTLAYSSNVGVGNFKVAVIFKDVASSTLGCSDNLDGAWSQAVSFTDGANQTVGIFYKANATAGATTVTFTGTGASGALCVDILEFSGVTTGAAFDQNGHNNHNSFSNTLSLTSGVTTQAVELVIAGSGMETAQTSTWGSFTQDPNGISTASVAGQLGVAYFFASSTGAKNDTITAAANTTMTGVIATFFGSSAGGAGQIRRLNRSGTRFGTGT